MKKLLNDQQVKQFLIGGITLLSGIIIRAIEKGRLRMKGKLKDGKGGTADNCKN